ncbi:MAG: DUF2934 domain-containing protein [Candidatus Omnitrophota bacterium]
MAKKATKTAVRPAISAKKTEKIASTKMSDQNVVSMIEKKAYELWKQRGDSNGGNLDNWLEAEQIILGKKK